MHYNIVKDAAICIALAEVTFEVARDWERRIAECRKES